MAPKRNNPGPQQVKYSRYPELITKLMKKQGSVTKSDVMELLHLDANQAYYQLRKLVREGRAQKIGGGRSARYEATR